MFFKNYLTFIFILFFGTQFFCVEKLYSGTCEVSVVSFVDEDKKLKLPTKKNIFKPPFSDFKTAVIHDYFLSLIESYSSFAFSRGLLSKADEEKILNKANQKTRILSGKTSLEVFLKYIKDLPIANRIESELLDALADLPLIQKKGQIEVQKDIQNIFEEIKAWLISTYNLPSGIFNQIDLEPSKYLSFANIGEIQIAQKLSFPMAFYVLMLLHELTHVLVLRIQSTIHSQLDSFNNESHDFREGASVAVEQSLSHKFLKFYFKKNIQSKSERQERLKFEQLFVKEWFMRRHMIVDSALSNISESKVIIGAYEPDFAQDIFNTYALSANVNISARKVLSDHEHAPYFTIAYAYGALPFFTLVERYKNEFPDLDVFKLIFCNATSFTNHKENKKNLKNCDLSNLSYRLSKRFRSR